MPLDPFLLLTPVYVLGVISLLGFLGCNYLLGITDTTLWEPKPPADLVASASDGHVQLDWTTDPLAFEYHLLRGESSGSFAADYPVQRIVLSTQVPYTDSVVNGRTYFYRITTVGEDGRESDLSDEVNATPSWPFGAFVTGVTPGGAKAGVDGLYGMAIEVGPMALTVQTLGRAFGLGLAGVHEMRIIDGVTNVELGHALVDMNSPADGPFKYAPLVPGDVTLDAAGVYYIVSEEFTAGDPFYNRNTVVQTRPEARVTSAVSSVSPGVYLTAGGSNQAYGPVSFQY